MILTECLLKFLPGDIFGILKGIAVIIPPFSSYSNELVGGQENSVSASGMDDVQLLIDLAKPIVGFERILGMIKGGRPKLHKLRKSCLGSADVLTSSVSVLD